MAPRKPIATTNESAVSELSLAERLGARARYTVNQFGQYGTMFPPEYPFNPRIVEKLGRLLSGSLPIPEEKVKEEETLKLLNKAASITQRVTEFEGDERRKVIEGVAYYSEETVGLAALKALVEANETANHVVDAWKKALNGSAVRAATSINEVLSQHLGFDVVDRIVERRENAVDDNVRNTR